MIIIKSMVQESSQSQDPNWWNGYPDSFEAFGDERFESVKSGLLVVVAVVTLFSFIVVLIVIFKFIDKLFKYLVNLYRVSSTKLPLEVECGWKPIHARSYASRDDTEHCKVAAELASQLVVKYKTWNFQMVGEELRLCRCTKGKFLHPVTEIFARSDKLDI